MAQDGPKQEERIAQIARALEPHFHQVRLKLAQQIAQAQDGRLIEQTEVAIFTELNQLKTKAQEVGLQERIHDAEAAFSPSGAKAGGALQGSRRQQPDDPQRPGGAAAGALAEGRGWQ